MAAEGNKRKTKRPITRQGDDLRLVEQRQLARRAAADVIRRGRGASYKRRVGRRDSSSGGTHSRDNRALAEGGRISRAAGGHAEADVTHGACRVSLVVGRGL